eukprot:1862204-Prymnesium_polylepis.1
MGVVIGATVALFIATLHSCAGHHKATISFTVIGLIATVAAMIAWAAGARAETERSRPSARPPA